jgi:hypothetical protein
MVSSDLEDNDGVKEEAEKPSDGRVMMKEPYLSEIEDSKRCEATEVRACLIQC